MDEKRINIPHDRVARFCRENGIARLALFGSILRDDFRPDSDVDMLIEFHPCVRVGYLAMARMARELLPSWAARSICAPPPSCTPRSETKCWPKR